MLVAPISKHIRYLALVAIIVIVLGRPALCAEDAHYTSSEFDAYVRGAVEGLWVDQEYSWMDGHLRYFCLPSPLDWGQTISILKKQFKTIHDKQEWNRTNVNVAWLLTKLTNIFPCENK
jgi:hypothetical protein